MIYVSVVSVIQFIYKRGWIKVYRFPLSVVVVGNLTVGGNGKTPMVLWLVQQLKSRGWIVGVVSRGYGGYSRCYPIILDQNSSSIECGDEALIIWQRAAVPVAVSPKRADAVSMLLRFYPFLDVIVSDDGLQHYALGRDIEWVMVNSKMCFGNGWCLPAGPMRERIGRLNSVQQVIFCGERITSEQIVMRLFPVGIINLLTGERRSVNSFPNVVAMAGISYPSQFFSTLRSFSIVLLREISFSDHQVYSERMLYSLVKKNETLLMTEKDAVKCRLFARINWWYLEVEARLTKEETKILLGPIEKNIYSYKKNFFFNKMAFIV